MIYETRWDFIQPFVEGKRVLDIGPAELVGTINRNKIDRWIHRKIANAATSVVGIEKNMEQVQKLSSMGYDIREGDAEEFDLDEKFDIVFAGELIEHLSNPGNFLNCAKKHLLPGGKILLTTPNRFSILSLSFIIRFGQVEAYHKPIAKHVLYFDEDSLCSLLKRHGFSRPNVGYCKWVGAQNTSWKGKMLLNITKQFRPMLLPVLTIYALK